MHPCHLSVSTTAVSVTLSSVRPQMTVWSPSTASGDPTSPSSPTPPVGRPERLSKHSSGPTASPHPTWLHSREKKTKQKKKSGATAPSSQHCLQMPSLDVTFKIWKLRFSFLFLSSFFFLTGRRKSKTKTKITVVLCDLCRLTTESVNTTLHFLIVTLYTEQASIHHNEGGNAVNVMHKSGHYYECWKGPFCIKHTQLIWTNHFKIEIGILRTKKPSSEQRVCALLLLSGWMKLFSSLRLLNDSTKKPFRPRHFWLQKWMYRLK